MATSSPSQPLAYSYVRMSTDAQLKGDSLRRQTELSRQYSHQHGLQLVEDFKLEDIGISAFKGDNVTTGALSKFLKAVRERRVPAGSYLLVESLDRLSRDKITTAMQLFLSITEGGVNIVTLSDGQVYRAGETEFPQLIYSLAIMSRANDESRTKSLRVGAAWRQKRANAATKKLTKMTPAWMRLPDGASEFELIPERTEVVRQIFRLSIDGLGTYSIVQRLNRDGVAPFGRSNGWNESYIEKIVKNRAVLGEYQPHEKVDGKRRPVGDVVRGYFPAIITEDEFYAAQAARRARATFKGGRKGTELKNLFTHVATCAYCGSPMRMVDKGKGPKGGRYLKCSAGVRGMGCTTKGWRYEDFERSFLFLAREVDLAAVMNAEADDIARRDREQRLAALSEKAVTLQLQRDRMIELSGDPSVGIDFIRSRLASVQAELAAVTGDIDQLQRDKSLADDRRPLDTDDLRRLIEQHGRLTGTAAYDHRVRLAAKLRSVVKNLTVSTEGDRPRVAHTLTLLDDGAVDPAFAAIVSYNIEKAGKEMHRYNPGFQVVFAGGVTRRATVSVDDPMNYVLEALIKPEVGAKVDLAGTTVFAVAHSGPKIPDTERP